MLSDLVRNAGWPWEYLKFLAGPVLGKLFYNDGRWRDRSNRQ